MVYVKSKSFNVILQPTFESVNFYTDGKEIWYEMNIPVKLFLGVSPRKSIINEL